MMITADIKWTWTSSQYENFTEIQLKETHNLSFTVKPTMNMEKIALTLKKLEGRIRNG
jgi:hypothetical protein